MLFSCKVLNVYTDREDDAWRCFNPLPEKNISRMMLITDANEILIGLQHLLIGRYQLFNIIVGGSKLLGMQKMPKAPYSATKLLFMHYVNIF